jgi:putative ABC transport system permease protein
MDQWLRELAYRVKPSIGLFLLVGVVTLLVSLLITTFHSMRAARINPVDVLRDE